MSDTAGLSDWSKSAQASDKLDRLYRVHFMHSSCLRTIRNILDTVQMKLVELDYVFAKLFCSFLITFLCG